MKKYLIVGHNTKPELPRDLSPEQQQAWGEFFTKLGSRIVDGGNPLAPSDRAIVKEGSINTLTDTAVGYYMISAESLEEASKLVLESPYGNAPNCEIRVYETIPM
ncbi:MAG TPA: hypothetical protein VLG36_04600 [Candidatus Chromulinivoraceae bacterium]|nr:hypothetical protein [Candidatus Chromulinivoraceae bacterium]